MRILEAAGYRCARTATRSFGKFDIVAIGPRDIRLRQVECGGAHF
jgi:hypothetical protein